MSTITSFSAQELRDKLDLIDLNKNLLPYPYTTTFPAGLEDVGDGSVLTTLPGTSEEVLLAAYALPAGTYTVSIEVTDIIDITKTIENPGFELKITGASVTDGQFTLDKETTIQVQLVPPSGGFGIGLLVKPQIEKGLEKTTWVPYMDKISNYVDERFNGISAKLRVLAQQKTGCTIVVWDEN